MRCAAALAVVLLAACAPPPAPEPRAALDDTVAVLQVVYDDMRGRMGRQPPPPVSLETTSRADPFDTREMLEASTVDGWRIASDLVAAFVSASEVDAHDTSTIEAWSDVTWTPSTDDVDGHVLEASVPAFGRDRRTAIVRCDAWSPHGFGSFGNVYVLARTDDRWVIVDIPAFWIS